MLLFLVMFIPTLHLSSKLSYHICKKEFVQKCAIGQFFTRDGFKAGYYDYIDF